MKGMSAPSQTFAALGDPVRATIVDCLSQGDATVGELVAQFEVSFQAVSQHIGVLERAGIVTRHREGRSRRVHLEPAGLRAAEQWLEERRQRLEARYQRLDNVLAQLQQSTASTTEESP